MTAGQNSSETDYWIYHRLSLALPLTSLHVSFLSPSSGLSSRVLLSAVPKSIHSLHHYLPFELHLPLALKSNTKVFGVLQPDSIRHGSLRGTPASSSHLLLHNSHHYGKQHLAFIQLHSLNFFSTPSIFNLPFLCIVSHSCALYLNIIVLGILEQMRTFLDVMRLFNSIFLMKSCFLDCGGLVFLFTNLS